MDTPAGMSWPRPGARPGAVGAVLLLVATLAGPGSSARGEPAAARPDYWVIQTRACPQIMGTDPWAGLATLQADGGGRLTRRDPGALLALAADRPVVFLVHGSYYSADLAAREGLRIRDNLAILGVFPPGTVVVAFDWPSQLVYPNPVRDGNEKGRRAFVAGYHLARVLQEFPPGARACLIGHSHGGLVVLSALHLLGGGVLDDGERAVPPSALPSGRPRPRARAVVVASASDRHWLDPGERLGNALLACEGLLSLHNRLDPVLVTHPLGRHTDHRVALGRSGLGRADAARLGTLGARYREGNVAPLIGVSHNFEGTVSVPSIAGWIAPYVRWPDARAGTDPRRSAEDPRSPPG